MKKGFILSGARTGSQHLLNLLANSGQVKTAPKSGEIFCMTPEHRPYQDIVLPYEENCGLHMHLAWQQCDIFKVLYYHLFDTSYFDSVKSAPCVHLKRRNIFAQYVSLCVARKNGRWACDYENGNKIAVIKDDFVRFSEQQRNYINLYDRFLTNVTEVFYEDSPEEKCRKLCEAFDLGPFEPRTDLIKTNPVDLSLVVENYDEVKQYDISSF